jgi:hypothetical protein
MRKLARSFDEVLTDLELSDGETVQTSHADLEFACRALKLARDYFHAKASRCKQCEDGNLSEGCTCSSRAKAMNDAEFLFWAAENGCTCTPESRLVDPLCPFHSKHEETIGALAEDALEAQFEREGEDAKEWEKIVAESSVDLTG